MGRTDILHKSPEAFHFLDIYLSRPLLRVDDDATTVVGIVPRLDQDIDLPADPSNPANDVCVRCNALIGFRLLGKHTGH